MLSRKRTATCSFLMVLTVVLGTFTFIGCGDDPDGENGTATSSDARRKKETQGKEGSGSATDSKMSAPQRLKTIKMAPELKTELFYEGDGTTQLRAAYNVVTGKLSMNLTRQRVRKTKSKKKSSKTSSSKKSKATTSRYAGIYTSDRIQGPYKLTGRLLGNSTTLQDVFPLEEVRRMYCLAVTYSEAGVTLSFSDPVKPEISATQPKTSSASSKRTRRSKRKKSDTTKKEDVKDEAAKNETPPVEPAQDVSLAVVMFMDNNHAVPAEYFERRLTEDLTRTLSSASNLKVCRQDLVGYTREQKRIAYRDVLRSKNLKNLNRGLQAQKLVFGEFWVTEDTLRLNVTVSDTVTEAQYMVADVTKEFAVASELADEFLDKLTKHLSTELSEEVRKRFSDRFVELVSLPRKIAGIRKHITDMNFDQAAALFESLKADQVRDPVLLSEMSEAYSHGGNAKRAGELAIAALRLGDGLSKDKHVEELTRTLLNIGDLRTELDLLALVELPNRTPHWKVARTLIDHAVGKGPQEPKAALAGPVRTWPLLRPGFKVEVEKLLFNPTVLEDAIVIFSSTGNATLRTYADVDRRKGLGGTAQMQAFEAKHFVTSAYDASGQVRWEVTGLMTPTVTPVAHEGLFYGVRDGALIAVEGDSGKIKWESSQKPLTLPRTKDGIESPLWRPWWRTWELRVIDDIIMAWDPDGDALHCFKKTDGTYVGRANYQTLGALQERMFLEVNSRPHYMQRGLGTLKMLTAADLANPYPLQKKLCLAANNRTVLEDGRLYEVRRRGAAKSLQAGQYQYYVVCHEANTGKFNWMHLLLSMEPPVVHKGQIYRLRPVTAKRISSIIEVIDPTRSKMTTVDLTDLVLDDVTPMSLIMGNSAILVGTQAALRTSDHSLLWVNRQIPAGPRPILIGENLFSVGPILARTDTGIILAEMNAGEDFDWEQASITRQDDRILVWGNAVSVKGRNVGSKGSVMIFVPKVPRKAQAKSGPTKTVTREVLSPEKVEEVVWSSRIVPLPGNDRWALQERIALWKFQKSSKPQDAIDYLLERSGQPARTIEGPFELVKLTRSYALLLGDMEPYLTSLKKFEREGLGKSLTSALQDELDSAKEEIAKLGEARTLLEQLRAAEPDTSHDFGSARGTSSMLGSTGGGITPPFKQKWKARISNQTSETTLIMPVGDLVVALAGSKGDLRVLSAADGKVVWKTSNTASAACYRGVLFLIRKQLEARHLATGTVLWRSVLPAEGRVMAAGKDTCVVSTEYGLFAYKWDTGELLWKKDLSGCDRLELHGDQLVAGSSIEKTVNLLELSSGKRLWNKTCLTYAAHDGYLYTLNEGRTAKDGQELKIERTVLLSAKPDWQKSGLLPLKGRIRRVPSPVVTDTSLLVAYGGNLLVLNPVDGSPRWRRDLPLHLVTDMTASASTVYVGLSNSDLYGYDLIKAGGTNKVKQSQVGEAAAAMGDGVLYVLKRGELIAMEGEAVVYPDEYLAKLREPTKRVPAAATQASLEEGGQTGVSVKPGTFATKDCMRSQGRLVSLLTDKVLSPAAFEVLLDYADYQHFKGPAEKYLLMRPMRRSDWALTQTLTADQGTTLTHELVQRGTPEAVPLLVEGVTGRFQLAAPAVALALKKGDPNIFAPRLLTLCKQSLTEKAWGPRPEAVRLFGTWKYLPAIPFLTEQIQNEKMRLQVRLACIRALGEYGGATTNFKLSKVMTSKMNDYRLTKLAGQMLAAAGPEGIKALGDVLTRKTAQPDARVLAAESLGRSGSDRSRALLQRVLGTTSAPDDVRAACALSLGLTGDKSVVPVLVKFMRNPNSPAVVSNACLNGLAASKNRNAVSHLINAIGSPADNRQFRRVTAAQMLQTLTGMKFGIDQTKWRQWYEVQKDKPWKTGL